MPNKTTNQNSATTQRDASACCGGPAPSGANACCVQDADVKATGGSGCGCSSATRPAPKMACCS